MANARSVYICQQCGAKAAKWIGKCPSCGSWNTYVEEVISKPSGKKNNALPPVSSFPKPLSEVRSESHERIDTKSNELNRILGGGIVPGSVILIGGEPGIGKSTLALQIALALKNQQVLYVSGEESLEQIKIRAERLKLENNNCLFYSETHLESIINQSKSKTPGLLIIDSVQTLYSDMADSSPGSLTQIRECTNSLIQVAKRQHLPVILIGHITKEGNIAGPKILEHMVDVVLNFEGDQNHIYRIIRSMKNRFGSTSEIGIYEMRESGLKEIPNPSEFLLSQFDESLSGTAIAATIDGIRPFLIEVQSLVSSAVYGNPQRSTTGFDIRRINMLLAVLEKRAHFKLSAKDVFLNIAGGIKVNDPAIDLAVVVAILSSSFDIPVSKNICFAGEIGLSGEIRPVSRIEQRITEAGKLGFQYIIISKYNQKNIDKKQFNIDIKTFSRIDQVLKHSFGH